MVTVAPFFPGKKHWCYIIWDVMTFPTALVVYFVRLSPPSRECVYATFVMAISQSVQGDIEKRLAKTGGFFF